MRNTRVLFTASLVAGVAAALGAGCGSSKSSGSPSTSADGSPGGGEDAAMEASGGPGSGCSPIGLGGPVSLCDPGMDLTCCVDLSGGVSSLENAFLGGGMLGTCTATASCMGALNVQCEAPTDCTTGQSCCGTAMGDAGALTAELAEAGDASFSLDASFDASGFDASSLFAGLGFTSACASSCSPTSQYQLCTKQTDCTANPTYVCGPPSAGLLGGGGGASLGGFSISSVITFMICQPADAGSGTTPTDAGTTEKPDAEPTDAGTGSTDTGTGSTDAAAVTDGATTG